MKVLLFMAYYIVLYCHFTVVFSLFSFCLGTWLICYFTSLTIKLLAHNGLQDVSLNYFSLVHH